MKVCAMITEYNPFHMGHKIAIRLAKEKSCCDYFIVIMSGSFVQRGDIAIYDKYERTRKALKEGVDLVLELPTVYSLSNAGNFALSSVSILDKLGICDNLCFGSNADINTLDKIANISLEESSKYKIKLKSLLKEGLSYPKAKELTLIDLLKDNELSHIIQNPNSILGMEYLAALKKLNSTIIPLTYNRKELGNGHSATKERKILINENKFEHLKIDDLTPYILIRLLENNNYEDFLGINKELSNRIIKSLNKYDLVSNFIKLLNSKNNTHSAIARAIMTILLNIKKEDFIPIPSYCRILGYRKNSQDLINYINKKSKLSLIYNINNPPYLDQKNKRLFEIDLYSYKLHNFILSQKYNRQPLAEQSIRFIKI